MFDPAEFFNHAVNGIPLIFVVMGAVKFMKDTGGLTGNQLRVASLVTGLLLGIGYQLSLLPAIPVEFAAWFAILIYGLALGVFASTTYDVIKASK